MKNSRILMILIVYGVIHGTLSQDDKNKGFASYIDGAEIFYQGICLTQPSTQIKIQCRDSDRIKILRTVYGYNPSSNIGTGVDYCTFSIKDCNFDTENKIDIECTGKNVCQLSINKTNLMIKAKDHGSICNDYNYVQINYQCLPNLPIKDICGFSHSYLSHAYITSPNFPNKISSDTNCECTLQSTFDGGQILLRRVDMKLPDHKENEQCSEAYLEVLENNKYSERKCGYIKEPGSIYGSGAKKLKLSFVTGKRDLWFDNGFWLEVIANPPREDNKIQIRCNKGLQSLSIFKKLKLIEEKLKNTLKNRTLHSKKLVLLKTNGTSGKKLTSIKDKIQKLEKASENPTKMNEIDDISLTGSLEDLIMSDKFFEKELNELKSVEENEILIESTKKIDSDQTTGTTRLLHSETKKSTPSFHDDLEWNNAINSVHNPSFSPLENQQLQSNLKSGASAQISDLNQKSIETQSSSNSDILNNKLKKRSTIDEEIYLNEAQWLKPFSFNFIKHTTLKYKPTLITNTSNTDTIGLEMVNDKQRNYTEQREQNKPKIFASLKTFEYSPNRKNQTSVSKALSLNKIAKYLNNSSKPNECHFKVLKIYKIYKPEDKLFCKNKSCVDWKLKTMLEKQLNGSYRAEVQPKSLVNINMPCMKLQYEVFNFNQLLTEICSLNTSQNLSKIKWTIYLESMNCSNITPIDDQSNNINSTDLTKSSFESQLASLSTKNIPLKLILLVLIACSVFVIFITNSCLFLIIRYKQKAVIPGLHSNHLLRSYMDVSITSRAQSKKKISLKDRLFGVSKSEPILETVTAQVSLSDITKSQVLSMNVDLCSETYGSLYECNSKVLLNEHQQENNLAVVNIGDYEAFKNSVNFETDENQKSIGIKPFTVPASSLLMKVASFSSIRRESIELKQQSLNYENHSISPTASATKLSSLLEEESRDKSNSNNLLASFKSIKKLSEKDIESSIFNTQKVASEIQFLNEFQPVKCSKLQLSKSFSHTSLNNKCTTSDSELVKPQITQRGSIKRLRNSSSVKISRASLKQIFEQTNDNKISTITSVREKIKTFEKLTYNLKNVRFSENISFINH